MSKTEVELICDGGPDIGYGHIRRMSTLASALRRSGIDSYITGLSEFARSQLPLQLGMKRSADVIVIDSPRGVDKIISDARNARQRVVALDWFGHLEPDIAVVIYPHQSVRAQLRSYIGLEFQIISAEIANAPRFQQGDGVVIVLGGGDLLGQGHRAAAKLVQLGLKVSLIQGPLASCYYSSALFEVLINPPDLIERLLASDWVVTNGGTCMFEAMCLGKAAFVLPQTRLERTLADFVWKHGALLGVGQEYFEIPNKKEQTTIAKRASQLIDGKGAERVAKIVETLL